jgi:hypothetical protein
MFLLLGTFAKPLHGHFGKRRQRLAAGNPEYQNPSGIPSGCWHEPDAHMGALEGSIKPLR